MTSMPQSLPRYRRDATVTLPARLPDDALSDGERQLLRDHEALGCHTCVLDIDGVHHPLVFVTRWRRNIPHAYLIYAPDRRAVLSAIGNVAVHLLKRGYLLVAIDCNANECASIGSFRKSNWHKYYAGPAETDGIDYAYSELVYMGNA